MFENIIGQDNVVSILRSELGSRSLPSSLLFYGEPYSGKLSTALETARALTCTSDASWGCACRSCALQRLLAHPATVLMGTRPFLAEIAACRDVLERQGNAPARYLYLRAVRKLVRRFDPFLWEGYDGRLRSVFPVVREVEEMLGEMELEGAPPRKQELSARLDRIRDRAGTLAAALPRDNVPVHVIRKAAFWARLSAEGQAKVIIIENAERMGDSSWNSLLKLLEEPPPGVYLILLAANKNAVAPTILSRVRRYRFAPRGAESSRAVIERIFRDSSGAHASLAEYFLNWERLSGDRAHALARQFLEVISDPHAAEGPLFAACQKEGASDPAGFFREFVRTLLEQMRLLWRHGALALRVMESWNRVVQNAWREQSVLNLQPLLTIQGMYYRMRRALE